MTRVVVDSKVGNRNVVPDDGYVLGFTIREAVRLGPDNGDCEIIRLFEFDSSPFNYVEGYGNLRS